jgi:hypothetical protein
MANGKPRVCEEDLPPPCRTCAVHRVAPRRDPNLFPCLRERAPTRGPGRDMAQCVNPMCHARIHRPRERARQGFWTLDSVWGVGYG